MEIRATKYDNMVYFVAYNEYIDDAAIEQQLICQGHEDFEIRERREAEAPDTNTEADLRTLNALQAKYDNVDVVRVRHI